MKVIKCWKNIIKKFSSWKSIWKTIKKVGKGQPNTLEYSKPVSNKYIDNIFSNDTMID